VSTRGIEGGGSKEDFSNKGGAEEKGTYRSKRVEIGRGCGSSTRRKSIYQLRNLKEGKERKKQDW